jgi:hypothetical protein
MNREMAELRKILDLFEGAGFTVTYLLASYLSSSFEVAIKSSSITKIDEFKNETAAALEVVSLVEKNGYRVLRYNTGGIISKYEGTIHLEIAAMGA